MKTYVVMTTKTCETFQSVTTSVHSVCESKEEALIQASKLNKYLCFGYVLTVPYYPDESDET